MPDIGGEIAKIENQDLDIEKEAELKEELFKDFTCFPQEFLCFVTRKAFLSLSSDF